MDFIKKKKKGSSLLIVVAMMAVVSIITISVLTMTTSGYKMRKDSNKRVENFYGADSGLEISERILIGFTEAAIDAANKKVDVKDTMDEKNKVFKKSFIEFFQKGGNSDVKPFHKDTEILTTTPLDYNPIVEEIKLPVYYDDLDRSDVKIYESSIQYKKDANTTVADDEYEDIKMMTVSAKSKYKKDGKERNVGVDFDITVPDYGKDIAKTNSGKAPSILDYIFGVDGDLTFDLGTTTQVVGDIWVRGNTPEKLGIPYSVENKYDGGIKINSTTTGSRAEFALYGGISTGGTLETNDSYLKIGKESIKNIYANNIVLNNNSTITEVDNLESKLLKDDGFKPDLTEDGEKGIGANRLFTGKKDIYVYNDLVLNGDSNHITTNNYYGLNDINNYENYTELSNQEKSSSIIINTNLENSGTALKARSKVTVKDTAYVLGTSYIDLGGDGTYQTGQSNSINNFSKPYTVREDENGNQLNYIYDYKGNLHLIDKHYDESELDVSDKATILSDYELVDEELEFAKLLSIENTLYNTGAMIGTVENRVLTDDNNKIYPQLLPTDDSIKKLQKKYAEEVFNMGNKLSESVAKTTFWMKDYAKKSVEDSFAWGNFEQVIKDLEEENKDASTSRISNFKKSSDNKVAVFDIKMNIGDIIYKANHEAIKPNLIAYGITHICPELIGNTCNRTNAGAMGIHDSKLVKVMISADDNDKITIKDTEGDSSLKKIGNEITYNLKNVVNAEQPMLVVAHGDVEVPHIKNTNLIQIITAGNGKIITSGSPAIIGNYSVPSVAITDEEGKITYEANQFNFINELFKYTLEDTDIMGDIGDDIFAGTDSKEVTESIEISDVIKTKNWELIK